MYSVLAEDSAHDRGLKTTGSVQSLFAPLKQEKECDCYVDQVAVQALVAGPHESEPNKRIKV